VIHLKFTHAPLDEVPNQLALITAFEDVRPLKGRAGLADWRFNGKLSQFILTSKFKGTRGEALLMPTQGRLDSQELLLLGMGAKQAVTEHEVPHLLNLMVEKILLKKSRSFCLSLSDLVPGMFEWRNTVRLFVSMISGRGEEMSVTLIEDQTHVEDAKKRHMDFSYDVKVQYELV
jgi:hypothetical protein